MRAILILCIISALTGCAASQSTSQIEPVPAAGSLASFVAPDDPRLKTLRAPLPKSSGTTIRLNGSPGILSMPFLSKKDEKIRKLESQKTTAAFSIIADGVNHGLMTTRIVNDLIATAGVQLTPALHELLTNTAEAVDAPVLDDAYCRKLGFVPKADAYANCRLVRDQMRRADQAADRIVRSNEKAAAATKAAIDAATLGAQSDSGMSFLCKDAIARGDSLGVRTHC